MENFIIYLFKSGIWIAVFWSLYRFFFRKETFFGFNRFFLLSGLALSFVLAFCRYRYPVTVHLPLTAIPENDVMPEIQPGSNVNGLFIVCGIYLAGVFVLLLHHLYGLSKIRNMIRKRKMHFRATPPVIEAPEIRSSFSFFGYIFMDKSANLSETEWRLILEHETAHIEQRHWIDLLLAQIICILQWFNPFAWLYRQAVRENHEFLADRSVIRKGNSPAVYYATLINYTFKTPVLALTNSFAYNNKFKRIIMMKKKASKSTKKFAVLLLLPALAVFLLAFAEPEYRYSVAVPAEPVKDTVTVADHATQPTSVADKITVNDSIKEDRITRLLNVFETEGGITQKQNQYVTCDNTSQKQSDIVYYIDGKETSSVKKINPEDIHSLCVFKGEKAMELYGKNNVVLITSKRHARETGIKNKDSVDKNVSITHIDPPIIGNNDQNVESIKKIKEGVRIGGGILNIDKDKEVPLIIIDGKECDRDVLNDLDKNKIESVSILKDTSLYGEKGKNGVIIIKTKAASKDVEEP